MIDYEPIVAQIRNRSWAVREIGTQHNAYVDQLLSHVSQLIGSLAALTVPEHVQHTLMTQVVASVCEQLVDGYAHTKKCSDEGRALMSLDVTTLRAGLRKLMPGQDLPMSYVDDYIKALYLPHEQILGWAKAHPQYSPRHLTGLVTVTGAAASMRKKEQQARRRRRREQLRQRPAPRHRAFTLLVCRRRSSSSRCRSCAGPTRRRAPSTNHLRRLCSLCAREAIVVPWVRSAAVPPAPPIT